MCATLALNLSKSAGAALTGQGHFGWFDSEVAFEVCVLLCACVYVCACVRVYSIYVCVCACVRVCERVCICVCMCVSVWCRLGTK